MAGRDKIVTIGEIMLRLQPPNTERFMQAKSFDLAFGGGEANVAVCLSQLGMDARFITKLPDNAIGEACKSELRKYGVDTALIATGGERLGIYYCEKGVSERPSRVIYDRKYSSFSEMKCEDIDIKMALDEVKWLHFTGITPALSGSCRNLLETILKEAKAANITISCDLNYRKKLWSKDEANRYMSMYMPYVDVLIANEEDAKNTFGIEADGANVEKGSINSAHYESVCKKTNERFGIKNIAITLRESYSASRNGWSAMLFLDNKFYVSHKYDMTILDRVGGGDSFAAGLIYALMKNNDGQKAVDYAVACSCLKHSVSGDFNIISNAEVIELLASGGNGRVDR